MTKMIMKMLSCVAVLLLCALGMSDCAEDILLYPPTASAPGPETLLICIPGFSVPATEYAFPCQAIQAALPFKTWVAVMSFRGNVVTTPAIEKGFDMAIAEVKEAGFQNVTNSDVFVWSHSAGGVFSTESVEQRKFAGNILFGSYLYGRTLEEYTIPTLTVGGELDGLTQITIIAEFYRVTRDLIRQGRVDEAITKKAVVVIPGMNHAQMCNNFIQGTIEAQDFVPEITLEEATKALAAISSAFIILQRGVAGADQAYRFVQESVLSTEGYVAAFLDAQDEDRGEWCIRSQRIVANLGNNDVLSVSNIEETDFDAFVDSKASLEVVNGVAVVVTHNFLNFTLLDAARNSKDGAEIFVKGSAATEIGCKCRSQDSIVDALRFTGQGPAGVCSDIHQAILDDSLKRVADSSRARFLSKGRQLLFKPDVIQSRGDLWVSSHLNFDTTKDPVEVTASRLTSANIPGVFGGANYCKGLAAAKVVSWILHDSLPRGIPTHKKI